MMTADEMLLVNAPGASAQNVAETVLLGLRHRTPQCHRRNPELIKENQ
jgi:phosphoglycerate dehydrogenase-like enzyme